MGQTRSQSNRPQYQFMINNINIEELEKAQEHVRQFHHYNDLPNVQSNLCYKWMGLKSLGYSDEECDRMCKPKPTDMEEVMRTLSERNRKELRRLARMDREERASRKSEPKSEAELLADVRMFDE